MLQPLTPSWSVCVTSLFIDIIVFWALGQPSANPSVAVGSVHLNTLATDRVASPYHAIDASATVHGRVDVSP
jgi:hypothetical protein